MDALGGITRSCRQDAFGGAGVRSAHVRGIAEKVSCWEAGEFTEAPPRLQKPQSAFSLVSFWSE